VEPIAPDALIGSMAAVRLPTLTTDAEAEALNLSLHEEDRIEVATFGWPVRGAREAPTDPPRAVLIRISAQRYNEPADYQLLADALVGRGLATGGALDANRASAIVSR